MKQKDVYSKLNPQYTTKNGYDDAELIHKKEKELDRVELRRMIQESVDNALIGASNHDSREGMSEVQRLHANEAKIKIIEDVVAELSEDSLILARRVLKLGESISEVNKIVSDIQVEVKEMKIVANTVEDTEDKFIERTDKKWESKRDTILKISVMIISIVAILVSIWGYTR